MTAAAAQTTEVVDDKTGEVLPISRGDALFVAMSCVKHVSKDSKGAGYQYRGIEAIMQAARPALKAANMSCRPVDIELIERESRLSSAGKALIYTMVRVTFRYATPDEEFDVKVIGEAFDSGDKGMAKAISVAQRTAHILALQIPTGEDTEEGEQHQVSSETKATKGDADAPPFGELESIRVALAKVRTLADLDMVARLAKHELTQAEKDTFGPEFVAKRMTIPEWQELMAKRQAAQKRAESEAKA